MRVLLPVFGSVDKQYLAQADGDRAKRQAIGTYEQSGLSGYVSFALFRASAARCALGH